jgi:GxxExxY protein
MENVINQLVAIAYDIYNTLGPGYNEVIYHRAMEVALRLSGIHYESEVITPIFYKGSCIGHGRVDLKLENIIIELKAINVLNNDAITQTRNYMNQHSKFVGLIINFGQTVKSNTKNIGFILIQGENIYDYSNGTFVQRGNELTL